MQRQPLSGGNGWTARSLRNDDRRLLCERIAEEIFEFPRFVATERETSQVVTLDEHPNTSQRRTQSRSVLERRRQMSQRSTWKSSEAHFSFPFPAAQRLDRPFRMADNPHR